MGRTEKDMPPVSSHLTTPASSILVLGGQGDVDGRDGRRKEATS